MSFAYNNMINVIGDIMAQYKIAVDAGHGGSDYGATYNLSLIHISEPTRP